MIEEVLAQSIAAPLGNMDHQQSLEISAGGGEQVEEEQAKDADPQLGQIGWPAATAAAMLLIMGRMT